MSERCQIASEVVDAFITLPMGYMNAISSPLLQHLAGIGSILVSVLEEPLSETGYLQVRSVLLAMAQLLANLDFTMRSTGVASERLRSHVARIDEYTATQRTLSGKDQHPSALSDSVRNDRGFSSYEPVTISTQQGTSAPACL